MATVTELLDRAAQVTGLQTTGTERTLALHALRDTYVNAVRITGCDETSVSKTFATSAEQYAWSDFSLTDVMQVSSITATTGGAARPLVSISHDELLNERRGGGSGMITHYCALGLHRLMFAPLPSVGDAIVIRYVPRPPELVEDDATAAQEESPTKVPVEFHWRLLLAGTVKQLHERGQRVDNIAYWEQREAVALADLKQQVDLFVPAQSAWDQSASDSFALENDQRPRWS